MGVLDLGWKNKQSSACRLGLDLCFLGGSGIHVFVGYLLINYLIR